MSDSPKDFHRLRESGERSGVSLVIGRGFGVSRDAVARGLIALGLTPNGATVLGCVATIIAGWCLAHGAGHQVPYFKTGPGPVSYWPALAAIFLFIAGGFDMLDGAIARLAAKKSRFGGILDSTLDRISDMAIAFGCVAYFGHIGSRTYVALALVGMCASFMISYVKARADVVIDDCSVGFWLRGERCAALLIGAATGHIPAVLWQLAIGGALTTWRRVEYSRRAAMALDGLCAPPRRGPESGWVGRLQLYRHPRGSVPYDLIVGLNIAFIVFAPLLWPPLLASGAAADPLGGLLGGR